LFSRQDLCDSFFSRFYHNSVTSSKIFKLIVKEKFELDEHIEVPDKLITPTFVEEADFLDSDTIVKFKTSLCDT
jgi:hypothetical protein